MENPSLDSLQLAIRVYLLWKGGSSIDSQRVSFLFCIPRVASCELRSAFIRLSCHKIIICNTIATQQQHKYYNNNCALSLETLDYNSQNPSTP